MAPGPRCPKVPGWRVSVAEWSELRRPLVVGGARRSVLVRDAGERTPPSGTSYAAVAEPGSEVVVLRARDGRGRRLPSAVPAPAAGEWAGVTRPGEGGADGRTRGGRPHRGRACSTPPRRLRRRACSPATRRGAGRAQDRVPACAMAGPRRAAGHSSTGSPAAARTAWPLPPRCAPPPPTPRWPGILGPLASAVDAVVLGDRRAMASLRGRSPAGAVRWRAGGRALPHRARSPAGGAEATPRALFRAIRIRLTEPGRADGLGNPRILRAAPGDHSWSSLRSARVYLVPRRRAATQHAVTDAASRPRGR